MKLRAFRHHPSPSVVHPTIVSIHFNEQYFSLGCWLGWLMISISTYTYLTHVRMIKKPFLRMNCTLGFWTYLEEVAVYLLPYDYLWDVKVLKKQKVANWNRTSAVCLWDKAEDIPFHRIAIRSMNGAWSLELVPYQIPGCLSVWLREVSKYLICNFTRKYSYALAFYCPRAWIGAPDNFRVLATMQRMQQLALTSTQSIISSLGER